MNINQVVNISDSVAEYGFEVLVNGHVIPGILWLPTKQTAKALIALGHGGSGHKKSEGVFLRAVRNAQKYGWASIAIDAPKHGERISAAEAERETAKTWARISGAATAPSLSPEEKIKFLDKLAAQAVPEWQAAIDAVLNSKLLPAHIPMAYWGVSQGSSIGIPLLATDKRFICAVLGLSQLHPSHSSLLAAAKQIKIPLRFVFQWHDPIRKRAYGLSLFNAFGSSEKSMHINPGGHLDTPAFEVESWDLFFLRHLA